MKSKTKLRKYKSKRKNKKKIKKSKRKNTNLKLFNELSQSFIPIHNYLSKNVHKGNQESYYDYYESFSNAENVFNYFYILKKNRDKNVDKLCIPSNKLYYNYKSHKFANTLDFDNYSIYHITIFYIYKLDKIIAPKNFKNSILNCNERFILVSCNIQWGIDNWDGAHQTIILFDNNNKTVELFDPEYDGNDDIKYDTVVESFINSNFDYKYNYIGSYNTTHPSKNYGPQVSVDAFSGLCVTWSIMYVLLRLSSPDKNPSYIVTKMMDGSKEDRKNNLLKFAKKIKSTIKQNVNLLKNIS